MKMLNILVAGVGGQGTLLASDILAEVGMRAGHDVKKSDVLGLAVRGGSVLSHVRWGASISSPVVRKGGMDYLLAFEPLEALRGVDYLHKGSVIVSNTQPVAPVSVSSGGGVYPSLEKVREVLTSAGGTVHLIAATAEAVKLGNARVANVVLLGAFSSFLDIPINIWEETLLERVPTKYVDLNRQAFASGQTLIKL
jgi:indolepyruvate ferredoxin oxidoreductase beta subunit